MSNKILYVSPKADWLCHVCLLAIGRCKVLEEREAGWVKI
jgi:hypothetical protein